MVSNAMSWKAEEVFAEFKNCPNGMFRLVRGLRIYHKEVDGGSDEKLSFSE